MTQIPLCLLLKFLTIYGAKPGQIEKDGGEGREKQIHVGVCVCVLSELAEGQVLNVWMNSIARPSTVHPHESHKVESKVFKLSCFMQQVLLCGHSQNKKEQFSTIAPPLDRIRHLLFPSFFPLCKCVWSIYSELNSAC